MRSATPPVANTAVPRRGAQPHTSNLVGTRRRTQSCSRGWNVTRYKQPSVRAYFFFFSNSMLSPSLHGLASVPEAHRSAPPPPPSTQPCGTPSGGDSKPAPLRLPIARFGETSGGVAPSCGERCIRQCRVQPFGGSPSFLLFPLSLVLALASSCSNDVCPPSRWSDTLILFTSRFAFFSLVSFLSTCLFFPFNGHARLLLPSVPLPPLSCQRTLLVAGTLPTWTCCPAF